MTEKTLTEAKSATAITKALNEKVYETLNFADKQDFEDAQRGFIAPFGDVGTEGKLLWNVEDVAFLNGDAPETVNPSLWRNAQLQAISGLFKVVDGVYQVRGQAICTTVIIEGKTGIIVVDVSHTAEVAQAALELYYSHRPKKPVSAVIISQSHLDHWGGIEAVLAYSADSQIPIIVPDHFTEEALSENILLGPIMGRRAEYQIGYKLTAGIKGYVSIGIGHRSMEGLTSSFELPNVIVKEDTKSLVVDGITLNFLLALNTEAPAEMHFYIEDYRALFISENANKTIHQIYAVRGAKTRDALKWVTALDESIDLVEGKPLDVLIMIHAWPVWGKDKALEHLRNQRDVYKYLHDQTVRLANLGYTMDEIAETIHLPKSLDQYWANRGYYGTLKHNSKGIYNFYLGYYNANPSDLDPLPQTESAHKYVQYLGGADNVLQLALADFEKGEYRWVAQVLKHVVFDDPDHTEAKELLADAYEQLGYQAESALWRNMYLTGADELRNGFRSQDSSFRNSGILLKLPVEEVLKQLSVRLNGPKAEGVRITINAEFLDVNQRYVLTLENSVLVYKFGKQNTDADVFLTADRAVFYAVVFGRLTPEQAVAAGKLELTGDADKLREFVSLFEGLPGQINIVTP